MSAIPAQTLLDESKCYLCYGVSQADALKLALLNRIAAGGGSSGGGDLPSGAKVYRAQLTQTGVAAPVATVLQNTLGGTPVWSYFGVGNYVATLANAFTANKTFVLMQSTDDIQNVHYFSAFWSDASGILVQSGDSGGALSDGTMINISIQIIVFP